MRVLWLLIASAVWASAASADPTAPSLARAQQCLSDHVDRVVADDPDIHSAASFLVEFVCARPIATAGRYERNKAIAEQYNEMMKALGAAAKEHDAASGAPPQPNSGDYALSVDPDSGNMIFPQPPSDAENPGFWVTTYLSMAGAGAKLEVDPDPVPSDLRALAADLVLAARERLAPHR